MIASDLMQAKKSVIILLAGASGTGKSTLASLIARRFGIQTVLSTDSIRHVMRNFLD
jgi:2-phosphoglycerate kinase